MNDYERGLAALHAVNRTDGSDWDRAGEALFNVLELLRDPSELHRDTVEALGRVVREDRLPSDDR